MITPVKPAACFLFLAAFVFSHQVSAQQEQSYDQIALALYEGTQGSGTNQPQALAAPVANGPQASEDPAEITYDIYRDRNTYPLDYRKPCYPCTRGPGCNCHHCRLAHATGYKGQPWREYEPGARRCGKNCQHNHPLVNVYWPNPLSGLKEELHPKKSAWDAANYGRFHVVDIYDHLGGFEVSRYQRRDNGYFGPGRDCYGCLGESRQLEAQVLTGSRVGGVGFRPPAQPVPRGVPYP